MGVVGRTARVHFQFGCVLLSRCLSFLSDMIGSFAFDTADTAVGDTAGMVVANKKRRLIIRGVGSAVAGSN